MKRVCAAYAILGLALWPLPLLNVLQAESAAVVAFASFFVAGWHATSAFAAGRALWRVLLMNEVALLVPLGMLLVAPLWAPNCTLGQGLLFYGLFPCVSVGLSVAWTYLLTGLSLPRPFWLLAVGGAVVAVGGPIYDLSLHPQFYTYNHVFGGVLGPVYDEQLAVRWGLFAFRGLTLLWAVAAVFGGRILRGHGGVGPLVLCLTGIVGVYIYAGPLGINTTPDTLRSALPGHHQTPHFDLYYDPASLDSAAVAALAADHEAHYRSIRRRLNIDATHANSPRIQSYLYPDPDTRGHLTGARTTSVAPVWLKTPQIHLLERRAAPSLGHEIAHVLARPHGLPGLRASWAPGLVEGWAVALEPPSTTPSSHDLVSAAQAADAVEALQGQAEILTRRLSPWGFWTGRGAVSYATMGSFVDYLLRAYGPERLKQVYAWANFETVYGRPLRALAHEWERYVQTRPLASRAARGVVARRFTRPSLFEASCPHYVPPSRRRLQAARQAIRQGDTARARTAIREALDRAPRYKAAHAAWARLRLADGQAAAVRQQLDTLSGVDQSARLLRLRGDARALSGTVQGARADYAAAVAQTPRHRHEDRVRLMLRDAVAPHPAVVRVLVSDDSARTQARRLARLSAGGGATAGWQVLRLQAAHQYVKAADRWGQAGSPIREALPRAWHQAWAVQWRAWRAEAAARAGRERAARRFAREGSRRALALGARAWARAIRYWGTRSVDGYSSQRLHSGHPMGVSARRTPENGPGSRNPRPAGCPVVPNDSAS